MPGPGPAYNLLCVLTSAADILSHAARIRAAQATAISYGPSITANPRKHRRTEGEPFEGLGDERSSYSTLAETGSDQAIPPRDLEPQQQRYSDLSSGASGRAVPTPPFLKNLEAQEAKEYPRNSKKLNTTPEYVVVDILPPSDPSVSKPVDQDIIPPKDVSAHYASLCVCISCLTSCQNEFLSQAKGNSLQEQSKTLDIPTPIPDINVSQPLSQSEEPVQRHLRSSKVPSSRIGRFFHYGGTYKVILILTCTH